MKFNKNNNLRNYKIYKKDPEKSVLERQEEGDKKRGKSYDNDKKHWSDEEVNQLLDEHAAGFSDRDIAFAHKRRITAVRRKRKEEIQKLLCDASPDVDGKFFSKEFVDRIVKYLDTNIKSALKFRALYDTLYKQLCKEWVRRKRINKFVLDLTIEEVGLMNVLGGPKERGYEIMNKYNKAIDDLTEEEIEEEFSDKMDCAEEFLDQVKEEGNVDEFMDNLKME